MYCKECGTEFLSDAAEVCLNCGVKRGKGNKYCMSCGTERKSENQDVCLNCGNELKKNTIGGSDKTKIITLLLAIFLGGFGGHLFYVGRMGRAVGYLALTLGSFFTCGITGVVALVLEIIDIYQICTDKFKDTDGNIIT